VTLCCFDLLDDEDGDWVLRGRERYLYRGLNGGIKGKTIICLYKYQREWVRTY